MVNYLTKFLIAFFVYRMNSFGIFLVFCISMSTSSAQKYDYIWPMGYGDDPPNGWGISKIDFNGPKVKKEFLFSKKNFESSYSGSFICDVDGELLLLSAGCSVMDAKANVLPNGNGLNPGRFFDLNCVSTTSDQSYPVINGNFFISCPSWQDRYILIHQDFVPNNDLLDVVSEKVYYTVIDKNPQGSYFVSTKNISFNPSWTLITSLSAVEHSDGDKWWVSFPAYDRDLMYMALFGRDGLIRLDSQAIGMHLRKTSDGFSLQARFSPNGSFYLDGKRYEAIYLYNFDRTLGRFSKLRKIMTPLDSGFVRGICFSSNSRFLYITQDTFLYQYDLWDQDIEASVVEIGHVRRFTKSRGWPYSLGTMFLGPDCRIYVSPASTAEIMHVIHYPNRKGKDCGFEVDAITMPTRLAFSVPNIMTFRTTEGRQLCDSTKEFITTSVSEVSYDFDRITIQPNPSSDHFVIHAQDYLPESMYLRLVNAQGQTVLLERVYQGSNVIDTKQLPAGLYSVVIYERGAVVKTEKIVIIR